jgi:hypothetical protein
MNTLLSSKWRGGNRTSKQNADALPKPTPMDNQRFASGDGLWRWYFLRRAA